MIIFSFSYVFHNVPTVLESGLYYSKAGKRSCLCSCILYIILSGHKTHTVLNIAHVLTLEHSSFLWISVWLCCMRCLHPVRLPSFMFSSCALRDVWCICRGKASLLLWLSIGLPYSQCIHKSNGLVENESFTHIKSDRLACLYRVK